MMDENEQQMTHSDNTQEHFIACYIRVPHIATLDTITQAIKDNGCDNAEMYAKEIFSLYSQELEKIENNGLYKEDNTNDNTDR